MVHWAYTIISLVVFYIIGGLAAALTATTIWPELYPWVGILCAVIYAVTITVVLNWASSLGTPVGGMDADRQL